MAGCHQKLFIYFTVFLIDDPPKCNLRLLFVDLDRRREAPKIFFAYCLQTDCTS
jgi:hypothetical protein